MVNTNNSPSKYIKVNIKSLSEISLLNNFCGEVYSISIRRDNIIIQENGDIQKDKIDLNIFKNLHNKVELNCIKNDLVVENKECVEKFECESQFIYNKNDKFWKRAINNLSEIEYFGGLDSFIPLFKIIKYLISNLGSIQKDNTSKINENNKYINNLILMVKDILKIIIKLICLSENNFKNFKRIIVALIVSLIEIIHALNNLSNLKLKSLLLNDEIFFILYVIMANSKVPKNIIELYENIFELKNNIRNYNFTFDYIIFDLERIEIKNLDWYFLVLFNLIISFFIYFDSKEKIPLKLIEQLSLIKDKYILNKKIDNNALDILLKPFISYIKFYLLGTKENIIEEFLYNSKEFGSNDIYLKHITYMINTLLNMKILPLSKDLIIFHQNNFIIKLKEILAKIISNLSNEILDKIKNNFLNHKDGYSFFHEFMPLINKSEFIDYNQLLMNEIIDYHGQYHKLIKELFIFNRLWSNQKLFYNDTLNRKRRSNIKYKNINYYKRNFQRPIIYPQLDYKYRYPPFSKFKEISKSSLYLEKEALDDYNFNLDIPELNKFVLEANKKILKEIKYMTKNKVFNVCLIKQAYHIPGIFIILNKNKTDNGNDKILIYAIKINFIQYVL